jgi:hypothetical protein
VTQPVDCVIPAAPKDYNKLPYVIDGLRQHVQVETIHVVSPSPTGYDYPGVVWHRDSEVLPYDRSELTFRPNWTFQQLLKLFQNVTEHDWYLVTDADIVVNKPLPLWDHGKPILYLGRDQNHSAYFEFNKQLLGFGRVYDHSFLSECTLYSKELVRDMLSFCGLDLDGFWRKLVEIEHIGCCPAESELYGSYVVHERPGLYEIWGVRSHLGGKYGSHVWTQQEIEDQIKEARELNPHAHLISLHSWEGKDK